MFIYYRPNGFIANCAERELQTTLPYIEVNGPFDFNIPAYISDDLKYIEAPARPSDHHQFDYAAKQWYDPRTAATEWPLVRAERDARLAACDWTQLPDVPLATKAAWATYRQALRDLTQQADPFHLTWPTPP